MYALMTALIISILPATSELDEARRLAPKYDAKVEVRLWDNTRVDLLSDTYAIEVDWAADSKWAEAIGQALYYAELTHRKPAVLLLKRKDTDRFVYRAQTVCARLGIPCFVEPVSESGLLNMGAVQLKPEELQAQDTIKAYMIEDPETNQFYAKSSLGFNSWAPQNKANIWTSLEEAQRIQRQLRSSRGTNSEIRTYLLVPVVE